VRLFIAIKIPDDIRAALAGFINELRAMAPEAKWVRAENLHVTLKFLGHTDESKRSSIETALAEVRGAQPVSLEFRGLGFFPNEKRPRVFWTGMECSPNLKALAAYVDHATHKLGVALEERPFAPHLTLARFDSPRLPPKLVTAIAENAGRDFGSMTTREFHLIESKLKPAGAEYTTLHTFPFAGAS
jgi:2'-5' RNA ligase